MAHVTFVTSGAACVGGTLQFENHAAVTGFVISVPPKTDDRCVTFAYHRPPPQINTTGHKSYVSHFRLAAVLPTPRWPA